MAVNTWVGGASGNETAFAIDANWNTTGVTNRIPTAADDVIIPDTSSGHKCVLDQARNINSFVLAPDGEFDQGNAFYIKGKNAAGEAVKCQGKLGDVSDFVVETQSAATVTLTKQSGAGSFRNLTITHASGDITLTASMNLSGNLTITQGTLQCNGATVEVAGTTTVTGTLQCDASAMFLGTSVTSDYALIVNENGTFTGGTGNHTIGSFNVSGSGSGGSMTLSSGNTTISSRNTSTSRLFEVSSNANSFANGGGSSKLIFTTAAGANIVLNKSGATLNNVQINHASCVVTLLTSAITMGGNLEITAGELDTGSDVALTVTGYCDVTGTLTLNDSAVSVGALRTNSGAEVTQGSSGTLALATGSTFAGSGSTESASFSWKNSDGTSDINLGGTLTVSGGGYFQPRTAPTYASVLNNVVANVAQYWVDKVTIGGTFIVNAGKKWQTYGGSDSFIVDGDVTLNGTLSATSGYLAAGSTGEMKFGSLTINSGGKYTATPLTTTITAETASHAWNNTGGTFTHNNGKVKIYDATGLVMGSTSVRENTFYDLEISLHVATYTCSLYDVTGDAVTILNNLDVTKGEVEFSTASDTITIHGLTNITADAKFCDNAGHDTNKIIHNGLVTNLGTYNINDGTTVKLNGGIRQLGTLTVK